MGFNALTWLCVIAVALAAAPTSAPDVPTDAAAVPTDAAAVPTDAAAVPTDAAAAAEEPAASPEKQLAGSTDWTLFLILVPSIVGCVIALVAAFITTRFVAKQPTHSKEVEGEKGEVMVEIATIIANGARDFLVTEYKYLTAFCVCAGIVIFALFTAQEDALVGLRYVGTFLVGAILSATAGWLGMDMATKSNVRTCHAAASPLSAGGGLNGALRIAFAGGAVMGFTVVGLGLLGLVGMFALMTLGTEGDLFAKSRLAMTYMTGFGFGASSIALFARVAGGIYTKAADVGADLVGKVEEGLSEDDPTNPAVIADNVGDNVGDVAGMGADLFESYVGSIIAACTLSSNMSEFAYPFWLSGGGVLCALVGAQCVKTNGKSDDPDIQEKLLHSLKRATFIASFLVIVMAAVFTWLMDLSWGLFGCCLAGLFGGIIIGEATEYCTSYAFGPTKSISKAGVTGPATVIIQGLGIGMLSCLPPVIVIVIVIMVCDYLAGGYGIAVAAVGMLSTLGVTLATDAYGPVADNAGGIAEMSGLDENVRTITDNLDALGNTTAATGKGFAIGSAVLTALSLLASFKERAELNEPIDIADPVVLGGVLIGAVLPFVFAALTMLSVRKAATTIIMEVRRQFNDPARNLRKNPDGTYNGKPNPDHQACINISTKASVDEMVLPGSIAILMPVVIGFLIGPKCLAGMLTGAISSGFMLAVMMSNAGGAWDNAKKYQEIELHAKGTEVHKATVVGDTVGDPFKDTSGPALNILIKLMSMVSLLIAPILSPEDWATAGVGVIPLVVLIIISVFIYCKHWKNFEADTEKQHEEFNRIRKENDEKLAAQAAPEPEEKTAEVAEVELTEQAPLTSAE